MIPQKLFLPKATKKKRHPMVIHLQLHVKKNTNFYFYNYMRIFITFSFNFMASKIIILKTLSYKTLWVYKKYFCLSSFIQSCTRSCAYPFIFKKLWFKPFQWIIGKCTGIYTSIRNILLKK